MTEPSGDELIAAEGILRRFWSWVNDDIDEAHQLDLEQAKSAIAAEITKARNAGRREGGIAELERANRNGYIAGNLKHKVERRLAQLKQEDK